MSAPRSDPGRDREPEERPAGHRGPPAYVIEISVPYFGDGGVQRLHARMKDPGPDPSDTVIEAG